MTLLLSQKDVASVLTMNDCIAAVETAFRELASGNALMPQRSVIPVADHNGVFLGMPAYIGGDLDALGLKMVTVYPDNPSKHDMPTIFGTLLLCDPRTGRAIAIMDAGFLTAVRTGAASGVATRLLARDDADTCVVFGAGVQAIKQLEAVNLVRPLKAVTVIDPVAETCARFADNMGQALGLTIEISEDAETAVRGADIVITASSSHEPIFNGDWLKPGTHINNIGSHAPAHRELDTRTIVRSKYVADLREASLAESGDLLIPIEEGAVTEDHIHASLGELLTGEKTGRESAEEITLFKSVGLAVQDVSTALAVFEAAKAKGVGVEIEL